MAERKTVTRQMPKLLAAGIQDAEASDARRALLPDRVDPHLIPEYQRILDL
jgi:hypothetical protein